MIPQLDACTHKTERSIIIHDLYYKMKYLLCISDANLLYFINEHFLYESVYSGEQWHPVLPFRSILSLVHMCGIDSLTHVYIFIFVFFFSEVILDQLSVRRNHILARGLAIGGPSERVVPPSTLANVCQNL